MKPDLQKRLLKRLKTIEGQVRGLERMVENHTYCVDVIVQSSAIKKALASFEDAMLENHLITHVVDQVKTGKQNKAISEVLKVHRLSNS